MTPLEIPHRWIATGPRSDTCARCHLRRLADGRWRTPAGDVGEGDVPACVVL